MIISIIQSVARVSLVWQDTDCSRVARVDYAVDAIRVMAVGSHEYGLAATTGIQRFPVMMFMKVMAVMNISREHRVNLDSREKHAARDMPEDSRVDTCSPFPRRRGPPFGQGTARL